MPSKNSGGNADKVVELLALVMVDVDGKRKDVADEDRSTNATAMAELSLQRRRRVIARWIIIILCFDGSFLLSQLQEGF